MSRHNGFIFTLLSKCTELFYYPFSIFMNVLQMQHKNVTKNSIKKWSGGFQFCSTINYLCYSMFLKSDQPYFFEKFLFSYKSWGLYFYVPLELTTANLGFLSFSSKMKFSAKSIQTIWIVTENTKKCILAKCK